MRNGISVVAALLVVSGSWTPHGAADRSIPFWPDEVPAALHAAVDGAAALETVRELGRFHRVQGSPGLRAAADYLKARLEAAGLAGAEVISLPADGVTSYAHFRSYLGWRADSARLEEVSPTPRLLASFPDLPVALADYSQDADVTARLVDVGAGTSAADYEGREIRGRIVLADGALPRVHRLAVIERGAAGFLSAFPNQTTAWSGEDPDLVRWGHLSPYETANTFAFMVSKRQAAGLRARLSAGEEIILRARVAARMVPASYDIVSATIPGTTPEAGEIVYTAHLCHQSAGANDDASGSAAILEVARSLAAAIRHGKLPRPRRTIRFLWLPEMAGSQAYLVRHPEIAGRMAGGIHMDMVGGLLATTRGTFHLSRTAESLPDVSNVIARVWFEHLAAATAAFAEHGGDAYAGFVWPPGSREVFLGDLRALEMGSDHQIFQESSFGVPMLYFHDWPDVTIHTNKDQPENLDATKLGRVIYLGAGIGWTLAALPDEESPRLLAVARAAAREAIAAAGYRAAMEEKPGDTGLAEREAIRSQIGMLDSLARLWPSAAAGARLEMQRLEGGLPPATSPGVRDARIPVRDPAVRGPLGVYYYDHLDTMLGPGREAGDLESRMNGVLAYEALNLADGRRSISDIRDILTGRYEPVPLDSVAEYFETLVAAKVLSLR